MLYSHIKGKSVLKVYVYWANIPYKYAGENTLNCSTVVLSFFIGRLDSTHEGGGGWK